MWVRVCKVSDVVTGEMQAHLVEGLTIPILITRLVDGRFVASAAICPHEDVMLDGGELRGTRVVCPGHGYQFDLETGRCAHDAALRLRRFPARVVGDEVHVLIDLVRGQVDD
jgi:nitrite reductase/ring-hydroxylating ferredoxin subunit